MGLDKDTIFGGRRISLKLAVTLGTIKIDLRAGEMMMIENLKIGEAFHYGWEEG